MILFHGSNLEISRIDLSKCGKYKDFGQGFYLTSIKQQAIYNVNIIDALKILLSNGIIQKLEDLETGYYLESDAYLENVLIDIPN